MRNIWVKIGLGAGGIFAVGMLVVTIGRFGKAKIQDLVNTDSDIRIPLMGIIPFTVADQRLGDLRRLTLLRDSPHHLTGVRVEARLGDSLTIDPLKDCTFLTVNEPDELNENTRFTCITDTAGLSSFGTVEVRHSQGAEPTTLIRTLMLPPEVVRQLQESMGPRIDPAGAGMAGLGEMGDSIRAAVLIQVQIAEEQARAAGGTHAPRVEVRDLPAAPGAAPAPPATRSTPATPRP